MKAQSDATPARAQSQNEKEPPQPIYLDSEQGFTRLEESDRRSSVTLGMYFVSQETQTFCGVASSTMVLNALVPKQKRPLVPPEWTPYHLFAQSVFFTPEVEKIVPWRVVRCEGMTLQQLGDALGTYPVEVAVSHASDKSEQVFREDAKNALSSGSCLIVNYLRTGVGQDGGGHFSPLAAYHEKSDSFLVYDVARYKYPPAWVNTKELWNAMNTTDSSSSKTRGYLLVTKRVA